jgi:hypothetical protein
MLSRIRGMFLFLNVAALLMSASLLTTSCGLTGSTGSTASNPTGLPAPDLAKQMTLDVAVPLHSTVAANCAAGDTNSCTQMTNIKAFCGSTTAIAEAFKPCVSSGWMSQ